MTHVEVALRCDSTIAPSEMTSVMSKLSRDSPALFLKRPFNFHGLPLPNQIYYSVVETAKATGSTLPIRVHCYALNDGESMEDLVEADGENLSLSTQTVLPARKFEQLWESIIFEDGERDIKEVLLNFMTTALQFSDKGVSPDIVTCNRIILLHGPPGTGKTTLCQGLAQKLSIRFSSRFSYGVLLEINTHSIFSKWFAESGKMVKKLFDHINEIANDEGALVFVLIDEVESLATARQSSMNGSDPSDAIRVVNALLTQIDRLRKKKNIVVMATSNLTECIDFAFLSRADIKQYIGPPSKKARYVIFQECIEELMQKGVIIPEGGIVDYDSLLMLNGNGISTFKYAEAMLKAAELSEGLSGRVLRRLPFLAKVFNDLPEPCPLSRYLEALIYIAEQEAKK